jgi:hypothetical protein
MTALDPGRTAAARTLPTEPVIAVIGLVATLLAQVMTRTGSLWLLLDVVGGLLAVWAARSVLRQRLLARAAETGRLAATPLADGLLALAMVGAAITVSVRGPEPRIAAAALFVVAVFGAGLSLLILVNGVRSALRQDPSPGTAAAPDAGVGVGGAGERPAAASVPARWVQAVVLVSALIAVVVVARDAVLR